MLSKPAAGVTGPGAGEVTADMTMHPGQLVVTVETLRGLLEHRFPQ